MKSCVLYILYREYIQGFTLLLDLGILALYMISWINQL